MESWGYADLGIHEAEKAVKTWLKVGFSKIEGREMFDCYYICRSNVDVLIIMFVLLMRAFSPFQKFKGRQMG